MKTIAVTSAILLSAASIDAAEIFKANNNDALNLTTSWVGGVVPGAEDSAVFTGMGSVTANLGANHEFAIERLVNTNNSGNVSFAINSGETSKMTLGAGGIYGNSNKKNLSLQLPVELAANQTWRVENCYLQLRGSLDLKGHTLVLEHGKYSNTSLYPAASVANGTFRFHGGDSLIFREGAATPDMDYVLQGGTLQINEQPISVAGAESRARNITVDAVGSAGACVQVYQNDKKSNLDEKFSGTLRMQVGTGAVLMTPTSSNHQKLTFASLETGEKGLAFFRGATLGTAPAADQTAGTANVFFGTAPTMIGGILPRAVFAETGGDNIHGLVTYDATYGIKELAESDYATILGVNSLATDNVRLVTSDTGAQTVTELPSGTTMVNSLFLDTGATTTKASGGLKVTAAEGVTDAVLKVKSGLVVSRNAKAKVSEVDAIEVSNVTIDLDGGSGMFVSRQDSKSNMTSSAPFNLGAKITNDGGKGVSFGSTSNRGLVYLTGSEQSDYTGPTRIINGDVRLAKSSGGKAIPENGTLEIYAGACQNPGGQLPDSAHVVIYGGTYVQKGGASNSGTAASDVFSDLTMYGGEFNTNHGTTDLCNMSLYGGTFKPGGRHRVRANRVTLSGGQVVLNRFDGNDETSLSATNGLYLVNKPAGDYCAVRAAKPDATHRGGLIRLKGGIVFTGNETNTNRVEIYCEPPSGEGVMSGLTMDGSQDFVIGDGAADVDLYTNFVLADSTATGSTPGAVVKMGAGTLMLANGGSHTGGTSVQAGRLIADGALAGDVTVAAGATFRGGDMGESGALAVGGNITFAQGAKLEVDPGAATTVEGNVVFSNTQIVLKAGAGITQDVLVMKAASFTGNFSGTFGGYSARLRRGGSELWLAKDRGLVVTIR